MNVRYEKPTPVDHPIQLEARVEGEAGNTVEVVYTVSSAGTVTARGRQTAVKLKEPDPIESEPVDIHAL